MADLPTGTVTLLATDIGNSTEHWEHHSRAMSQALARHDAILQEAVASHGGHVFKTVGDGCYAVFAAATDALNAALAAQTRAYSSNLGYNWPFGVRVALHTGGVEQHNDCLIGMADIAVARGDSERAARLLGAAAPHLERMRGFMPLADRSSYTRVLSAVQAHLDEDVFAALAISSWRKSHAASRTHANRAGGCIDNLLLTWKLYQETTIVTNHIAVSTVHHAALTVSNLERAAQFYMDVLGFQQVAEFGPKKILSNGHMILGLGPASDTSAHERFDESCVGLDHLSFSVASRADLARAAQVLDTHGVPHGDITDLTDFGIAILAFRDPDNIQLELTAPLGTL